MSDDFSDPTQPLRSVFTDDQIEFLRENLDEYDIDKLLNNSLKDLMTHDDKPSLTELMETVTDRQTSADSDVEPPDNPTDG